MKMREVNIKSSFPVVEDAKKLLLGEITRARFERIAVLKIVHGYGSTGKGGEIKKSLPPFLEGLKRKGEILDFIPGEEFSLYSEKARAFVSKYPELRKDKDYGNQNLGITLVIFRG